MATTSEDALADKSGAPYLELIRRFPLRPIRTDEDLDEANAIIRELISRPLVPAEEDYLDVLADQVERYEALTISMGEVSDAELLRFLLDENGLTTCNLAEMIGVPEATASEIVAGRERLARAQAVIVAERFHLRRDAFHQS